ncbi:MAG: hypothetical protein IIC91_01845 [Chloroflexi bacterium]|nr:hypothetical protein [Chloroflexota bacterium]
MMDITETIEGMKNALGDRLSTKTAYGEPIEIDGVTVIPVARVFLGFGAGGGVGEASPSTNGDSDDAAAPAGGGGGGGGLVQPLGFIEIDATGARWVPLEPSRAELGLRAMMLAAVMLPFGGRRGMLGRIFLLLIGQLIAGRISQPNLPPFEGMRFNRA